MLLTIRYIEYIIRLPNKLDTNLSGTCSRGEYMENLSNPTAQKLFRSLMQFSKAGWHQHSVAGCKPSEIRVLFCIKKGMKPDAHEMKVSEISKQLHVTSPTITQLLKGLEMNGLIERSIDPTDRRSVGIKLTEKGEMVTRKAGDAFASSLHGLM